MVYCGMCPYCGWVYEDEIYDIVKFELKQHMKKEHYEELLSEVKKTRYGELFGSQVAIEWYSGIKAYRNIKYGSCCPSFYSHE